MHHISVANRYFQNISSRASDDQLDSKIGHRLISVVKYIMARGDKYLDKYINPLVQWLVAYIYH